MSWIFLVPRSSPGLNKLQRHPFTTWLSSDPLSHRSDWPVTSGTGSLKEKDSTAYTRYKPNCRGAKGDTQVKNTSAHCLRLEPCKIPLQKSPWYTSSWFTERWSKEKMVINSDQFWFTLAQTVTEIVSLTNNIMLKTFVNLFMCLYLLFHSRYLYHGSLNKIRSWKCVTLLIIHTMSNLHVLEEHI